MYRVECNYQIKIDKENEEYVRVNENEKFVVNTINAYGDIFSDMNELIELINNKNGKYHHHPLTGPIYVENANVGDVLKVHIYSINVKEMAQSLSKSAGIYPLSDGNVADRIPILSERINDEIRYCNNIKLKYKPMIGMIANTPANDFVKTGHGKKVVGGNLDIPFITEDVDVYIPVEVDGAGLYIGDVHSIQGYGELSGIAMEASSDVVIDVQVLKPIKKLKNIFVIGKESFSNKECIGVIGIGEKADLEDAVLDSFIGCCDLVKQLVPTLSDNIVKSLVTLIGNSFNGQAFSKTSESTSIVVISKEDICRITKNTYDDFSFDIEKILFKEDK